MDFSLISTLYNIIKDLLSWLNKRKSKDPVKILEIRKYWKSDFEKYLNDFNKRAVGFSDIIIRDVSRMDAYPDVNDDGKGISPWFKVELKGIYHRGIELFLNLESIKYIKEKDGWIFSNSKEDGSMNVYLVGRIPFELIKSVEWEGDEYYNVPHIYCEFSKKDKQPYEELIYYRREEGYKGDYFMEIAKYENIKKLSRKLKVSRKF